MNLKIVTFGLNVNESVGLKAHNQADWTGYAK